MMQAWPFDVSLIIVNWNALVELRACLRSFREHADGLRLECIVVDNASADGSPAMVREEFGSAALIANSSNLGFAAAVNQGLAGARGRHIFVLNPDIVTYPGSLRSLVAVLDGSPDVGAVAPRLLNPDGTPQKGYFRKYPSSIQVLLFHTMLSPLASRSAGLVGRFLEGAAEAHSARSTVEQIPGGCMLVRREVIEAVGEMDERFGLFFEDVDWCRRMRKAGWRLALDTSRMLHRGGASVGRQEAGWIFGRFTLSLNQYMDKHGSWGQRFATKTVTVANSALVVAVRRLQMLLSTSPSVRESFRKHRAFLEMFAGHYVPTLFPRNPRGALPQ